MGDGAFGMSSLDIETAACAGAPITTVVLNNGGMGTYRGGYPTARELFGTTEMTGDYAKIAEGMRAVGITVTDPRTRSRMPSGRRRTTTPRAARYCWIFTAIWSHGNPARSNQSARQFSFL